MLVESNQFGATYVWGFKSTDAPTIDPNFVARGADLKWDPEVNTVATDGEGHAESRTTSKPAFRKVVGTFTGYIKPGFDGDAVPASFSWTPSVASGNRFWVVGPIGTPFRKGDYMEVSIEATSEAGITSAAS